MSAAEPSSDSSVLPATVVDAGAATTWLPPPAHAVTPQSDATTSPPTGEHRFGPFILLAFLGQGGMGSVYRARDPSLGRDVALKLLPGPLPETRVRERFAREVRAAARLHHPGIVAVHQLVEIPDGIGYAMDLVEGGSLAAQLSRAGPLAPRRAAEVVRDVALAIDYAHACGVVHRDLKPGNILLDADGRPRVADFGLARVAGDARLTRSGEVLGTPAYMAPEQARGEDTGAPADVYALGAVLYEVLAGAPPFDGAAHEVLAKVASGRPPPLARRAPSTPRDLVTICARAMDERPLRRYSSAGELALDLGRFLAGEPIAARESGPFERLLRTALRHRAASATAMGGALVLALLLVAHAVAITAETHRTREALARAETARREAEAAQASAERAAAELAASLAVQRAQTLVHQASEMVRQGHLEREVAAILDRAFASAPDYAPLHRVRGELALRERRWAEAHAHLERALALAPDDALVAHQLYKAAVSSGEPITPALRARLDRVAVEAPASATGLLARALAAQLDARDQADSARQLARRTAALELARTARRADPFRPEAWQLEAALLLATQAPVEALAACDHGLELDPTSPGLQLERARILLELGRAAEAREAVARAAPMVPPSVEIEHAFARAEAALGQLDHALERLDGPRAAGAPGETDALAGLLLANAGRLDAAVARLERALEVDPGLHDVRGNLGVVLVRAGRFDAARAVLDRGLALAPNHAGICHGAGRLAALEGRADDARTLYDRAIALAPRWAEPHNSRGALRLDAGDLPGAAADFTRAIELANTVALYHMNLGIVREAEGDLDAAIACQNVAHGLDPLRARPLVRRGLMLQHRGDLVRAGRDLERAVELEPTDPEPRWHLGALRLAARQPTEALADFERAAELARERHRGLLPRLSSDAGLALLALGRVDLAIARFERAVELEPRSALFRHNLAVSLFKAGRDAECRTRAREALALADADTDTWELLAGACERLGDHAGAHEAWSAIVARAPGRRDELAPKLAELARAMAGPR